MDLNILFGNWFHSCIIFEYTLEEIIMSKGSILYIGGFELPDRNAAAHRVLNNAKILRELGYNVIFCGVDKNISTPAIEPNFVYEFKSYPVCSPKNTKQWSLAMYNISYYNKLLDQYKDTRFIFAYNLHAIAFAKIIKECHKRKIRIISDCTEWYSNKFSFNPISFIKWMDTFLCMKYYQKKCDGMIAITSFLHNYYKKYISNIIVVPPLVDLYDSNYTKLSPKTVSDIKTFIYCGSPSAGKEDLGKVVNVFNSLSSYKYSFKIVGMTREEFMLMYRVVPNDNIIFYGRKGHQDALQLVRDSDYSIIIRPKNRTTMAGFPTKFSEAISCGTAVIANDVSDLSRYLSNGTNGYMIDESNLKNEFMKIFNEDVPVTQVDLFDYHNWIAQFDHFISNLLSE